MLAGRLCVVTGANTGIGRVIATQLAEKGARVVLACRSEERAEPVALDIRRRTGAQCQFRHLDLACLASVRTFASELVRDCGDVSVLVHNAGLMAATWSLTADGNESTYQVNTLAPWLLTQLLLPSLLASAKAGGAPGSARVVVLGSRLEKTGDLSDLTTVSDAASRFRGSPAAFNTFKSYGTSKAALSALTFEQARRLEGTGVCVTLCTPGMVNTELSRFAPAWLRLLSAPARWLLLRTAEKGAETPVWLASCADNPAALVGGAYFYDRTQLQASEAARSQHNAALLWATCEAQTLRV